MKDTQAFTDYTTVLKFLGKTPVKISLKLWGFSNSPWFACTERTRKQCLESMAKSDGMRFFSSWDPVMYLYEKIQDDIAEKMDGTNGPHENSIADMGLAILDLDKEEFFKQAVIAIKWYNNQEKQGT